MARTRSGSSINVFKFWINGFWIKKSECTNFTNRSYKILFTIFLTWFGSKFSVNYLIYLRHIGQNELQRCKREGHASKRTRAAGKGCATYSAFAPESRTTLLHFTTSPRTSAANASGAITLMS